MPISIGQQAPAFEGFDQDGIKRSSGDYTGKWLLLYFYPEDDTSGCTAEACGFRDKWSELKGIVDVIGVSPDDQASHQKFREKYNLPHTLLADTDRSLIKAYGVGIDFKRRVSFLIDPGGNIVKIYEDIDCAAHAGEVLKDVLSLRK